MVKATSKQTYFNSAYELEVFLNTIFLTTVHVILLNLADIFDLIQMNL